MTAARPRRIVLVFVDGVGLAPASPENPLATARTPTFESLLGGPLTLEQVGWRGETVLAALDACLGVEGLPQSATGQTTLFTGRNGAAALGRHVTAFPGPRLQALLAESSLFLQARRCGLDATFANAFSERYHELVASRRLRTSASVWAVRAAELALRGTRELAQGEAVSWDVVRDRFARREDETIAPVAPEDAGRHLAGLAARHHLTVFETFLTDLAGHGRGEVGAEEAIERVDGLLRGLLATVPPDVTLLLTSDHGNVEERGHRRHTRNTVPLLAHGRLAGHFADCTSLLDVTPRILASLAGSGEPAASE